MTRFKQIKFHKISKQEWKNFLYYYGLPCSLLVLALLFMSWASPIYQHAYIAQDMNASFAISKAIAHGEVYFKDIFEQRGLYFYLLQLSAGYLPYYQAKVVVWVLEVINFLLLYVVIFKMAKLRQKPNKIQTIWITVLLLNLIFNSAFFNSASPEEWCLVPIAYSFYMFYVFVKNKKFTLKQSLFLGLAMGYVINIKYSNAMSIAGLFFGYGLYLLFNNKFKYFFETVLAAVDGVFLGFVPAFIYFAATHALPEYFKYYFFANASSISLKQIPSEILVYSLSLAIIILITILPIYLTLHQLNKASKLVLLSQAIFVLLGVSLIGRLAFNYVQPIIIMLIALAAPSGYLAYQVIKKMPKSFKILVLSAFGIAIGTSLFRSIAQPDFVASTGFRMPSIQYYQDNNAKNAQYRASRLIDKYGGGSILSYGAITNTIFSYNKEYPKLFYFDQTTMSYDRYPKSVIEQINYLKQQRPVWVETQPMSLYKPKSMPNSEFKSITKKLSTNKTRSQNLGFANVTAYGEYSQKHKNELVTYPMQKLNQKDGTYWFYYYCNKYLPQNYAPVFLGMIPEHSGSKINQITATYQLVWVRKDKLSQYPNLHKQVIDLKHIQQTLNKNNS